jgi:uncharacterized glyoxalase superfamily protein PhnB
MASPSTLIPCLRFRDAPAAIDRLCKVFGFQKGLVVPNASGGIAHAQLTLGGGMLMLGSASNDNEYGTMLKLPSELNGAQTQTVYLVVTDADAVYERVVAAGMKIAIDIQDEEYGGRGFSCLDLDGHLWSVGTYDPWA